MTAKEIIKQYEYYIELDDNNSVVDTSDAIKAMYEYAEQREREAFEAARKQEWHSWGEYSGHMTEKYQTYEDYSRSKERSEK